MVLVSLFSDASFCQGSGLGGWGVYAKSARGHVQRGGPFRIRFKQVNEAELCAAVNGLYLALNKGIVDQGDQILFQVDNIRAVTLLLDPSAFAVRTTIENMALKELQRLRSDLELVVQARHVKGHTKGKAPRFYANQVCDKLARAGLVRAREVGLS